MGALLLGPSACTAAPPRFPPLSYRGHGAPHEEGGDEGGGHEEVRDEEGGRHEGDEGQEGEESERDCEGQGSHGARLLWEEGEDAGGLVEGEPGEEQAWEGRVQEEVRAVV